MRRVKHRVVGAIAGTVPVAGRQEKLRGGQRPFAFFIRTRERSSITSGGPRGGWRRSDADY
jgi:hypothetical protein